jgi:hypothetical protein
MRRIIAGAWSKRTKPLANLPGENELRVAQERIRKGCSLGIEGP